MKNKNPLYVVKGSTVLEAKNLFDMVLKRFNLEGLYEIMMSIFKMLLSQVQSYPMLLVVKGIVDQLVNKVFNRFERSPATT
jgi:hypothetical protein